MLDSYTKLFISRFPWIGFTMTLQHTNFDDVAKRIVAQVGKIIVLGVALGIGKPIGMINALFRLASADPSINLTIFTGLTLTRPTFQNDLEKLLVEPILERLLSNYEDPLYEEARVKQKLPKNIRIIEFFLAPAKFLKNTYVQQHYISTAYTHVVRDMSTKKVNVIAQQVAQAKDNPDQYSLSSNSDLFMDMRKAMENSGQKIAVIAEVNGNLPFMQGDAVVPASTFTDIVDTGKYHALFALPREEITAQDHLIGIYTSTLVKDGACLQIGIGTLSNAVANALIMRHQQNSAYLELLKTLHVEQKFGETTKELGATTPFSEGLYASTEMLSDEYLQLYNANILKKRVYDHVALQRLLNTKQISEKVTPEMLDTLVEQNVIQAQLTLKDLQFLRDFGIFNANVSLKDGKLLLANGETLVADLSSLAAKTQICKHCLGTELQSGKIIHAGFFIGSVDFYAELRGFSLAQAQLINMTTIARTNALSWAPELLTLQRQNARFINSSMMVTASGVIISDGLKNLAEVSGVGGQFDFVNMAQSLDNARSIINCRSTRRTKNGLETCVVWEYGNTTIPRFLRDIVITEYGIADCRSKTDAEVIEAILNITDSRFQNELLTQAKKAGKIATDYVIPEIFRHNTAESVEKIICDLQAQGYCKPYPFGCDLTSDEIVLQNALMFLKYCSSTKLKWVLICALFSFSSDKPYAVYLRRMALLQPKNIQEYIYKKLLKYVLGKQA